MSTDRDSRAVEFGQQIYDENGTLLGTVRGFDEEGFYVTAAENAELLDSDTSGVHAEALMWRCWECGEVTSSAP